MKFLLDTHAFLWRAVDSPKLSPSATQAIQDPENEVLLSAASAWELATKHRLGKLPLGAAVVARYTRTAAELRLVELPIRAEHALLAGTFESIHRDPFDRMLAAQAVIEGATLVTLDPAFGHFPVDTLW
jgi:PIN domain nuclease of toxin-antitoxin system